MQERMWPENEQLSDWSTVYAVYTIQLIKSAFGKTVWCEEWSEDARYRGLVYQLKLIGLSSVVWHGVQARMLKDPNAEQNFDRNAEKPECLVFSFDAGLLLSTWMVALCAEFDSLPYIDRLLSMPLVSLLQDLITRIQFLSRQQ